MNSPAGTLRTNTNNYINAWKLAYNHQSSSKYPFVLEVHPSRTPNLAQQWVEKSDVSWHLLLEHLENTVFEPLPGKIIEPESQD